MTHVTEMLLYLYAESPIHAGGAESLGALDLPVQREATTQYPVIWGQSLKGALRQAARDAGWDEKGEILPVFGSDVRGEAESAGSRDGDETGVPEPSSPGSDPDEARERATVPGRLHVGDGQLVAMPVPTLRRTFAWVTSHLALARLERKYRRLADAGVNADVDAPPSTSPAIGQQTDAAASAVWLAGGAGRSEVLGPCVVDLGRTPNAALEGWATRLASDLLGGEIDFGQLRDKLREDLLLVDSDTMSALVQECTEFVARVQLTGEKTVAHGPFYSEYLPAETILATSLTYRPRKGDQTGEAAAHLSRLRDLLDGRLHQIGGDETLGKGLTWTRLLGGAA
ncbi:MAG: type III-B CRISPR module RAMP protein Cmr4 [Micromonosporaceae bacterium]|nr:type III-B CRISPR module RAMP protein Cmr4 [Micromonosporaceae bacterium]